MAVKKLSSDIQSLFSSTIHLFSFKRAVEELVYNALDAHSTSIAIRIHIQENKIHVIDNGNGIAKEDFNLLGQRYATSKFVDMSRFQSAPNTYGFRGQALASLVDVSKCVKVTSRVSDKEETWTKTFYKGKCKETSKTNTRPSKGTTVEINEFLYNLNIQNKAIDYLNELNSIKTLLEQLSLVYNNVSMSLRDDSRNEIVFIVHKNRDVYQTLKLLHNIEKSEVEEFQVEKGQYKAIAYFAKQANNSNRPNLIFLNKRVLCNSHLHKLIQTQLKKYFPHTKVQRNKSKKVDNGDDYDVTSNQIPFHLVFITCPYYDYEISSSPTQSTLEFKKWNQINKLIEKVVKFYTGDLEVNKIKSTDIIQEDNDTRAQVKGIMKKILGSYPQNPGVSQMQNGIKGKLIKRKKKKDKEINVSKVATTNYKRSEEKQTNQGLSKINFIETQNNQIQINNNSKHRKSLKKYCYQINHKKSSNVLKSVRKSVCKKKPMLANNNVVKTKKRKYKKDVLVKAFKLKTDTVMKRCDMLSKEVENCLSFNVKKKMERKQENKSINYCKFTKNNLKENISIRKRIEETIIHDYIPLRPAGIQQNQHNKKKKKNYQTSHDLIKTIIESHKQVSSTPDKPDNNAEFENTYNEKHENQLPQLTYQSHQYIKNSNCDFDICDKLRKNVLRHNNFISKRSIENFTMPTENQKSNFSGLPSFFTNKNYKIYDINQINSNSNRFKRASRRSTKFNICSSKVISSHTIDFTETEDEQTLRHKINSYSMNDETFEVSNKENHFATATISSNIGFTYTLTNSILINKYENSILPNDESPVLIEENGTNQSHVQYCNTQNNFQLHKTTIIRDQLNSISNSNMSIIQETRNEFVIEPLSVCEAILESGNDIDYLNTNAVKINELLFDFNSQEHLSMKKNEEILPEKSISTEDVIMTNYSLEVEMNNIDYECQEIENMIPEKHANEINSGTQSFFKQNVRNENIQEETAKIKDLKINFNIQDRPRFLPKGMSPIITRHNLKPTNDFNLDLDYFEEGIYNKFMDTIQMHNGIYEAYVQNPNDVTTKAIEKVNNRLNKENSSLTFDTQSLKEAKVLGQVDFKFIAAIMKGKSSSSEYLVLFDQHAVHERIRLENNLSDYYNDNVWKSVKLDDVVLKLSKDEILYLHNYKDKLNPFGLHWTILNNQEIKLHAIPEAILGKKPRQVEKLIKAVNNLISEEVNIIKAQKGCASQYPKAIMDLVFSEACRYAIMFGDSLSKRDCLELIHKLSMCKTPFQCAHGRPVMAVIMEITSETRQYKINKERLRYLKTMGIQTE